MKKLTVMLLALFLTMSISAQIWIPMSVDLLNLESFRHQATYAIEDDLDNGIDGTDIFKVEGGRIFTNLSNLSTGAEELMDNDSDNTLVIGGVSPIYRNWKAALFYGDTRDVGSYFSSNTIVEEWDNNGDGSLDFMEETYADGLDDYSELANCILLNIGKEMGGGRLIALTYKRVQAKSTEEYEDSEYTTTSDISNGDILQTTDDYEDYYSEGFSSVVPSNLYSLSYSTPFMNWDLRADAYLVTASLTGTSDSDDYYSQDLAPASPSITSTLLSITSDLSSEEINGNLAGISARLSDENNGLLWEIAGSFGMIFGSGDFVDFERYTERERDMSAGNVYTYYYYERSNTTAPISLSGMNMGLSGRMEWQLSENVVFGLGLMLNSLQFTMDYDIDDSYLLDMTYDDGDQEPDDADDYIYTSTDGSTESYSQDITMNSIIIPVGVEVNFGKNKDWFLRLGALASNTRDKYVSTSEVEDIERGTTTIITGDGDTTVTYYDVGYDSYEDRSFYDYQTVDFAYGLGWKPSPNLSIDLLGMFRINNTELLSTELLQSLRLSATVSVQ